MAEEKKEVQQNQSDEIVGLENEKPDMQSLFTRLKKYVIPAGIAVGASVISIVVFLLVTGDRVNEESNSEINQMGVENTQAADFNNEKSPKSYSQDENKKADETTDENIDSIITEKYTKVNLDKYEVDTTEIMQELNYLFITPEDEINDIGLSPQDSIDTLSWLDKEMVKLNDRLREVESRERELEKLEYRVNQGLIKINQAESARIANLARLYDGMKPIEVAKLFANLSDGVVISIVPRMKPAHASKIIALMPPKRAAKISTQMITVLENK
jgi:flagellar motility protein MotE (MotC chaperone)